MGENKEEWQRSHVIDDFRLGTWVSNQRSSQLNEKQVELLDGIGFVWDVQENAWNDKFCRAIAGENSREITTWKNMQQSLLNRGKLSADRAKKIHELGIRSKEDVWLENYLVVKECFAKGAALNTKYKRWL